MDNLLWEGINLMIVGMGAVFVFLLLLVFATSAMSLLVAKLFPEPAFPKLAQASPEPTSIQAENDKLLAVISAAIHRHRSRHK